MRKVLFAVVLLLGISYHVQAQRHQISAGVGAPSSNHIADVFFTATKHLVSSLVGSDTRLENERSLGEFRVGYAYYPIERLSVGATASILRTSADAVREGTTTIGEYTSMYLTFAAEGTYTYLLRENVQLYGLLGAGFTNLNSEYDGEGSSNDGRDGVNYFNFHISPIGIAYGQQFGGTAEIGVGYRGFVSLGLYYKF